jgi:hypothetical protein
MPPSVSTSSALVCTRDHSLSLPPSLFPRLPQLAISLQTPDGALLVCVRISCACARVRACVNVCFKGICRLLSGRHSLTADRIGVCAYFPSQMVVFVCLSLLPFSCLGFCLGACLSNTHLSTLVCCTMYASALIFIVWLGMRRGRDTFTCINYNRQRGVFPKQPNSAAICQHCVGSFLSGART